MRYEKEGAPPDGNTTTLCTEQTVSSDFAGVNDAVSVHTGSVKVT